MSSLFATQSKPPAGSSPGLGPSKALQRKCACSGSVGSHGECEDCKKKQLQRRATSNGPGPAVAPPIVHDALRSPGQPLDAQTRAFFEPRLRHDFSRVRVHTDDNAAESARSVNALAYTVGQNVVFEAGQFAPGTSSGRRLLAHELAHVVQQHGQTASSELLIGDVSDPGEREAERMANAVINGDQPAGANRGTGPRLMRKLKVDKPGAMIPDPTGQGLKQTNAATVEGYLRKLAEGSGASVDPSSGKVSLSTAYCPGFLGGLVAGAKFGYGIFKGIPLLGPVLGGVGALVGGLIGGIAGLFGSKKPSAAASSSTPTGSTCLCDMAGAGTMWTIAINDTETPATLNDKSVRVPSPNSQKIWGSALMSGRQENDEPWLVLGHELCGHAWLEQKGIAETKEEEEHHGEAYIEEPKTAASPFRHERSVERENLIRKEHGLDPRGYRLKDPFCGESFWRDRGMPNGPVHWQEKGHTPDGQDKPGSGAEGQQKNQVPTYLQECAELRSQLPENKDGKYTIDKPIP
jgi:Domain of unknown function (DUF4157)